MKIIVCFNKFKMFELRKSENGSCCCGPLIDCYEKGSDVYSDLLKKYGKARHLVDFEDLPESVKFSIDDFIDEV